MKKRRNMFFGLLAFSLVLLIAIFPLYATIRQKPISTRSIMPFCPKDDPNGDVVYFPNPDNCETFYMCVDGIPMLMSCFCNLWFNPKLNICDWPDLVEEGICEPPK